MNDQARVGPNKVVSITYRILDEDGSLLEQVDLPVSYVHGGHSNLIEKVERALEGHAVGDEVEVTLEPEEGFGEHDPSLTYTDDLANVPEQFRRLGAQVEMQNDRDFDLRERYLEMDQFAQEERAWNPFLIDFYLPAYVREEFFSYR